MSSTVSCKEIPSKQISTNAYVPKYVLEKFSDSYNALKLFINLKLQGDNNMQLSRLAAYAVVVLGAVSFGMSAQAQLKNNTNPMHNTLAETAQMKDCLMCHQSYEAVAQKTEKMTPNPHSSHRGQPECTNCHKVTAKPHFECNDCHAFNIKMKGE